MISNVLEAEDLTKHFDQSTNIIGNVLDSIKGTERPKIRAIDGVDLSLSHNQVEGIVGESGCGKSTLMMTLLGLHEKTGGEIYFQGKPISSFTKKEYLRQVQIVPQNPYDSLDPKWTIRESLMEPFTVHDMDADEEDIVELLNRVQLIPADEHLDKLPRELSGGERQRVAIARCLSLQPDVILADEPVSMLDVSTQAAILRLLRDLVDEYDASMFYVSHDLSTVSYICDRVNVMYLGKIVEAGPTDSVIQKPKHPYTQALINAIPIPDPYSERSRTALEGSPSDPINLPQGCRFKDRCPERMDICDEPPLFRPGDNDDQHYVACHLYYDHDRVTN